MKQFYGTFGSEQLGGFGLHYHVIVEAPDEIKARRILAKAFDRKWSGTYDCEKFDYPTKYHTRLLGRLIYSYSDVGEVYYECRIV